MDALVALAESCHEPKEVFATQLRRIIGLTGEVRISKKFLRESMTLTQFEVARAYYEAQLRRQVEEDTPDHEPPEASAPTMSQPDDQIEINHAIVRELAVGWTNRVIILWVCAMLGEGGR